MQNNNFLGIKLIGHKSKFIWSFLGKAIVPLILTPSAQEQKSVYRMGTKRVSSGGTIKVKSLDAKIVSLGRVPKECI